MCSWSANADATAKALTAFLQHVRGHGGSDSDEAEPTEEDAEDGNANVIPLSKQQVQSLCKQLAQAKAAGAVAQLEVGQLRELLQWLMPQIARGAITVADNDEVCPAACLSCLAGLQTRVLMQSIIYMVFAEPA